MTITREPASALNVVALGLIAGLVAFITFSALAPDAPVSTADANAPTAQQSHPDNLYGDPIAMP